MRHDSDLSWVCVLRDGGRRCRGKKERKKSELLLVDIQCIIIIIGLNVTDTEWNGSVFFIIFIIFPFSFDLDLGKCTVSWWNSTKT